MRPEFVISRSPLMESPALLTGLYPSASCLLLKVIQSMDVRTPVPTLDDWPILICPLLES